MKLRRLAVVLFIIFISTTGCNLKNISYNEYQTDADIIKEKNDETIVLESKEIAESYRTIYEQAIGNQTIGNLEVTQEIMSCIGEEDYPVIDIDNQIDMIHPEKVKKFSEAVETESQSELTILVVQNSGNFIRYDLYTNAGEVHVTKSAYIWKENTIPEDGYFERYTAHTWKLSNGYLFFEKYNPPGFDGPSGHTAIRVDSLDEKCRELNRKYILPIGYDSNNMFISDWNEKEYAQLSFYDLYERLYRLKYQTIPAFDGQVAQKVYEIPSGEFESVFQTYFRIDRSTLQKYVTFDATTNCYQYRQRGLYDYAPTPNIPYPEVVKYEDNEDGTITLTVNAVWPEENLEKAFSHEVVIRKMEDGGFQYISNHMIPAEDNFKPTWYTQRLTDEEWNELNGE